ncbi:glutamyl-tRNA amidotransferase subunit A [Aureimonas sp. SA4125]|uniref:amidase n=1 Tax=Aureimonas sp. SA4125 TaxID=2826993 RepID=UPI001CC6D58F|nr:amidase family protein [Aureimonas sp. SA4125]BDA85722.1 glutamyl-tRNA amidotransferase subunit A [Aureimonas sp. SA4125]
MATDRLAGLGAGLLGERIATGGLRSADMAARAVGRIAACHEAAAGFAWFDAAYVTRQAEALDRYRGTGRAIGPLHGLPVAIGDLIDTRGIPTGLGTAQEAGRVPERDAFLAERLRAAGAVLVGKTAVAELGVTLGEPTRPAAGADARSSHFSAAAAAVATDLVPLAVEADTAGVSIRAAAEAGVVGYLPSRGSFSRRGCFSPSPTLAGIAFFARSVADVALLGDALHGDDDTERSPVPPPRLRATATSAPPSRPIFALVRTPFWDAASADTQGAFEEFAALAGDAGFPADLPPPFAEALAITETIRLAELSKTLFPYARRGGLSDGLTATIATGELILARDYLAALDWPMVLGAGLDALFARCDAVATPAAPGAVDDTPEARGFNSLWSLLGLPTITLPAFEDRHGNPIGLQLVTRRGDDARLLRNAHWLERQLADPHREE